MPISYKGIVWHKDYPNEFTKRSKSHSSPTLF